ncbi:MAG: HNH endonuclease [Thermomicrobiales bacterium]
MLGSRATLAPPYAIITRQHEAEAVLEHPSAWHPQTCIGGLPMRSQYTPKQCDRFWGKVDRRGPNDCWEWQACRNQSGYGIFSVSSSQRTARAHRVAYEIEYGPIPAGLVLDHLCRNRACCNPSHMEVVTRGENCRRGVSPSVRAMHEHRCMRGHILTPETAYYVQNRRGERVARCRICQREYAHARRHRQRSHATPNISDGNRLWMAKLNAEQVRDIRRLYASGEWTYQQLAKRFNVTYPTIAAIVRRHSWQHVAD